MKTLIRAVLAVLTMNACHSVLAQTYPTRPLRIVVGFPAGGPVDIVGRLLGARMAEIAGQQVIIENRAGANAMIGTETVVKSPPDGYTMVLASPGSVTISPAVYSKVPYDTLRDLAPVTLVSTTPEVLVVHPSVPARSVKELIALAHARPGELNIASTGSGSLPHMAQELFKAVSKTQMLHVPYSGAAPAIAAILGGQVHGMFADLPVLLPYIKSAKLRALAIADQKRSRLLPSLPTLADEGVPAVLAINWYGILVPAKTPRDVIARLHEIAVKALTDAATREKMLGMGADPVGSTPEQFGDYLRADLARWAKLAQTVSIKVD